MERNIKTSVIIPVYNTENYLEECIESVLAQTQKEFEIILVDDGSTDGSTEIIKYYEKNYSCVKAIYQKNQKLGAARNAGINIASGKYIYFADSDDCISKDLFESCYAVSEEKKLDFVMIDSTTILEGNPAEFREGSINEQYDRSKIGIEDRVYSGVEYWNQFFWYQGVYSNAYLHYINAYFLRKNKLYFEAGIFYEDMDWMLRIYTCADRIAYFPKKFYIRRLHGNSIMTVPYNDLHMKSSILACKKILRLALFESESRNQELFLDTFKIMLWRTEEILEYFCNEKKVENIWDEFFEFYHYVFLAYRDIGKIDKMFQVEILLVAEKIRENIEASVRRQQELNEGMSLENYKWQLIVEEVQTLSLDKSGSVIGIYGTGKEWNRFFSIYKRHMGEISATIFFIDTYKKSGEFYQGYPIYNVRELANLQYDSIIVASKRYKDVMLDNIKKYCSTKTEVRFIPKLIPTLYKNEQVKNCADKT